MATTKTAVLSSRVPKDIYLKGKYFADKKGVTISDWLKPIIIRAIYAGKRMKGVTPNLKRRASGDKERQ